MQRIAGVLAVGFIMLTIGLFDISAGLNGKSTFFGGVFCTVVILIIAAADSDK